MDIFNLFKRQSWAKSTAKKQNIFLDYASTTPVRPEVLEVMRGYEKNYFANPSALYTGALKAKDFLSHARESVAETLSTQKKCIIFTSGGTESNNLALLGVFESCMRKMKVNGKSYIPHIVTTNIEHPAILEVCSEIERRGGKVTKVKVSEDGLVSPKDVRDALTPETILVSVMYANNEIGTIEPIKEISRVIKDHRQKNGTEFPYFHTDACQAPLYLDLNILKLGVDMMTLDGIKIYGPRGFGVLFIKDGVEISPILFGGGQEAGLRSGTENVASALGFAKAFELAQKERESESERLVKIRDYAFEKILKTFPNAKVNGSRENRLPNNINICFSATSADKPNIDAEFAVISLDVHGISASYSSSCRTLKEDSSSYVVEALGNGDCSLSSLRFTLGKNSTKSDIDRLVEVLVKLFK